MDRIQVSIHTDDPEFSTAAHKYWLIDETGAFVYRTGEIAKELGVSSQTLTSLIRQHTTAVATDKQCTSCERFYPLTSRTSFNDRKSYKAWTCHDCIELENRLRAEEKSKIEQGQRSKIAEMWKPQNYSSRPLEEYSLMDAVSVLSMIRGGAAEDYSYIKPINFFDEPLAPTEQFIADILNYIFDRNLLMPHPGSHVTAFKFVDSDPKTFYIQKVHWIMPEWKSIRDTASSLEEIVENGFPDNWQYSSYEVWHEIILQEGLELLQHYAGEHRFQLQIGEKTMDVLTSILRFYSIAQLQNFLWRATKDAAAYYVRGAVSRPQAANSIITRLQGTYEHARADGWEIKPYKRLFNLPQSLISKIFFSFMMKLSDDYRNLLPPVPNKP